MVKSADTPGGYGVGLGTVVDSTLRFICVRVELQFFVMNEWMNG